MSQRRASAALLACILAASVTSLGLLPVPAASATVAGVRCSSFPRGSCETHCGFDMVSKICCHCFEECCPVKDEIQKPNNDLPPAEVDAGYSEEQDSEEVEGSTELTAQKTGEEPTDRESPERLILAPKSAGFLPSNFHPVSTVTTTSPLPTPSSCVETGFPDVVHENGSLWYSLERPCQVLKCYAGVTTVALDGCGPEAAATQPPPPTTTTAAGSSGHYYPCTDSSTGVSHPHGATWSSGSVNCVTFRCMNGTVQMAGFFCLPEPVEPEEPGFEVPGLEAPGFGEPGLEVPRIEAPGLEATEPEATEPSIPEILVAPPVAPKPSSPDGDSGETDNSCIDDYGQVQSSGNVWTVPARPCLRYHCQHGAIRSSTIPCAPTPPGCTPLPVQPDQCCPSHVCPQGPLDCSYNGRTYSSGQEFADHPRHPCQQKKCDDGLVVSLSPPTACPAVYCAEPAWPEGACCKTCPADDLPDGLEELKNLVLRIGQRLNLPIELMTKLENVVTRLVAQLANLMLDSNSTVTLVTLGNNLITMTNILVGAETGAVNPITDIEVLLARLRLLLFKLVGLLKQSLTNNQVLNAEIDIKGFIEWLRALETEDRSRAAVILMNDLTRLFSGLLMEPGCTDSVGTVHSVDTLFVDDPGSPRLCYVCASLSSGVAPLAVMNVSDCGGPPPAGCTARLVPNSCCPRLQCNPGEAACRDDQGQFHSHNSIYFDDPKHPCITYSCSNGVSTIIDSISCMPIPPGCSPWEMDGFCCPKSDCPEPDCVYEGQTRDHGTSWPRDPLRPCEILTCLKGQVTSEDRSRHCPPPPADHCLPRQVDYQCCPEHDCVSVTCTYNGTVYPEGATWSDDRRYPCKRYSCTRQGTEKVRDLSELCEDRPHAACTGHRAEGQCCKDWLCPKCSFGGRSYNQGDIFWENSERRCARMLCHAGEPVKMTPRTVCPPIPDGCSPVYSGTGCCHVGYSCPFCMFDPQGKFINVTSGVENVSSK